MIVRYSIDSKYSSSKITTKKFNKCDILLTLDLKHDLIMVLSANSKKGKTQHVCSSVTLSPCGDT